jgi:2-polyprenyl-6-methoxyphenol hydroxylase-like FAD-dependent oxidoreductase
MRPGVPTDRRVLVVGGGISGLTAATALAQAGIETDLVEIKPALGDEGGIGLSIMGNASIALARIGVARACVEAGMPADVIMLRRPDGAVLAKQPAPRLGWGTWPGMVGIARAAFHRILADAALASGVRIRCGTTLEICCEDSSGVEATLTDGATARYDLIVAADGIRSSLRERYFADAPKPALTGQAVWRGAASLPPDITQMQLLLGGRHGAVGICPISPGKCYTYVVEAAPERLRFDDTELVEALRERLAGYGGPIPAVAATLREGEISYRPLEWLLVSSPWYRGRIVLIGDAAHANPPVLAQGAAMGIEDAVVLAEELASQQHVEAALARFMERRFERVRLVVEMSCKLAKWEVDHTPGTDVPGVMDRVNGVLTQPF